MLNERRGLQGGRVSLAVQLSSCTALAREWVHACTLKGALLQTELPQKTPPTPGSHAVTSMAGPKQKGGGGKHKKAFHAKQSRRSKAESDEIAALEAELAAGAPPHGSNPLAAGAAAADGQQAPAGYASAKRFDELPISEYSKQGLREAKYVTLTAVQRAALPHALCGRDVLGAAKTGSGAAACLALLMQRRVVVLYTGGSQIACSAGTQERRRAAAQPAITAGAITAHTLRCPSTLTTHAGKTLAFLLPAVEALYRQRWSRLDGLGALIISPTRELALQVGRNACLLCACLLHMLLLLVWECCGPLSACGRSS